MKNNGLFQHKFFRLFTLLVAVVILTVGFSSCSSSKHYGQTQHKYRSSYKDVRVKQPRWNTTTSTSTTYYIKKQKPRKRYNP